MLVGRSTGTVSFALRVRLQPLWYLVVITSSAWSVQAKSANQQSQSALCATHPPHSAFEFSLNAQEETGIMWGQKEDWRGTTSGRRNGRIDTNNLKQLK